VGSSVTAKFGVCENANNLFNTPTCLAVGADPFIQMTDEDGKVFRGSSWEIASISKPEGDVTNYTWDNRQNLKQVTSNPKPGSSLNPVSFTANFDTNLHKPIDL